MKHKNTLLFRLLVLQLIVFCGYNLDVKSDEDDTDIVDQGEQINKQDIKSDEDDTNIVEQGEQIYNQNCVFCHQADAIGKPGLAPSLTNKELLATASDTFFLKTIINGRPGTGMPPFGHIGEDNIKAIIAFLRSHSELPNRSAEIDQQPDAHGDPRLGKDWFEQICSTCHGPNGDGYSAGGTGTAIGKSGFLNSVSDGFIRTTIKEGRSNTRMKGFQGSEGIANLTDREIDDIIVYLRSLPKAQN